MRVLVTGGSGFIGTHLCSRLLQTPDVAVLNLDSEPPRDDGHRGIWQKIDITDAEALKNAVVGFQPTHIVHLAAVATFYAESAKLLATNAGGTTNVLEAALACGSLQRILIVSTQYVNGPGAPFDNDLCFHPVNVYGESKVLAEKETRRERYASLPWVIGRPTNVWGPLHTRFAEEVWRYIKLGWYLHPGHQPIVRTYAYVGNVVSQIEILLRSAPEETLHRVFYLTDPSIDSFDFLNGFSLALRKKPLRRVPYGLLKSAAIGGDAARAIGIPAPIFSERLGRMTAHHGGRFESLWSEYAYQPVVLSEGIERSVAWLKQAYPQFYQ